MKKNVLICGLIGGVIVTCLMLVTLITVDRTGNFDHGMVYGYAGMILAFSLIFVGVKNFRDKYNGGVVSFGKALSIGLLITLVASTFYVITWMIEYHYFFPDFMDKYNACMITKYKAAGMSATELAGKTSQLASMTEMYKNPFFRILMTYAEIVPVGIVVSLIAAAILRRKRKNVGAG